MYNFTSHCKISHVHLLHSVQLRPSLQTSTNWTVSDSEETRVLLLAHNIRIEVCTKLWSSNDTDECVNNGAITLKTGEHIKVYFNSYVETTAFSQHYIIH